MGRGAEPPRGAGPRGEARSGDAGRLGGQLLEILAEAHAEGLLHRHLTEDEVFLAPEGRLLLASASVLPEPGDPTPSRAISTPPDACSGGWPSPPRCGEAGPARPARSAGQGAGPRHLAPTRRPAMRAPPRWPRPCARPAGPWRRAAPRRWIGPGSAARVPASRVAALSARRPRLLPGKDGIRRSRELWHALVLLVASLLLMAFVLTTGWLLLGRDGTLARPRRPPALSPPARACRLRALRREGSEKKTRAAKRKTRADHSPGLHPPRTSKAVQKNKGNSLSLNDKYFKRDLQVERRPLPPVLALLLPSGAALGGV